MASKLQEYRRMSEEAQRQLTGSLERWQSFLATASRLYKYPYHEQVMIHAQRPDATACAEFDVWNNTMRRYVRRGSKGIALIDTSGDRERLRYVFDCSSGFAVFASVCQCAFRRCYDGAGIRTSAGDRNRLACSAACVLRSVFGSNSDLRVLYADDDIPF